MELKKLFKGILLNIFIISLYKEIEFLKKQRNEDLSEAHNVVFDMK